MVSGITLNVIRTQKARSRVDVAANQHGRVEITDNVFVVLGQRLIRERRLRYPQQEDKNETATGSKMLFIRRFFLLPKFLLLNFYFAHGVRSRIVSVNGYASELKLARCPDSLAASFAALPSMSLIPLAPF